MKENLMNKKWGWVLLSLAVALGFASSGFFIGRAIEVFKRSDRTVTVKGLAEKNVESDLVIWNLGFQVAGDDLGTIEQKFSEDKVKVLAFLKAQGFESSEISEVSTNVLDRHTQRYVSEGDLKLSRYTLQGNVIIKSSNLKGIKIALEKINDLLKQGITFTARSTEYDVNPRYLLTKFNELRPALLEEATQNAKATAEKFASTSNTKVGRIRTANQGVVQILSPEGGQTYNQEDRTLEKQLRVVSTFVFDLE
jgi:hypothetical protein